MEFTKLRLNGLHEIDFPIIGVLPTDDFILKNVDGLGPPESTVSISRTLQGFGTYRRRQTLGRQIVMTVGLNAAWNMDQTPGSLRKRLYGLLTSDKGDEIRIDIMNGATVVAFTTGVVKRIEPLMFTKDPQVQITIDCVPVYLHHPLYIEVDRYSLNKTQPQIMNEGDAPTGIHFEFIVTDPFNSITIHHAGTIDNQNIRFNYPFQVDDMIIVDTRPEDRQVSVVRSGHVKTLIGAMSDSSDWFQLYGGLNTFFVNRPDSFDWGNVWYVPKYWGV